MRKIRRRQRKMRRNRKRLRRSWQMMRRFVYELKKQADASQKAAAKIAKDRQSARRRTVVDAAKVIAKVTPELQNATRVLAEKKDKGPPGSLVKMVGTHVAQMTKFKVDAEAALTDAHCTALKYTLAEVSHVTTEAAKSLATMEKL